MTLMETVRTIEAEARLQPSVNMIVRSDVYRISKAPDRRYGIFAWVQQEHSANFTDDFTQFHFSLFYVDRLTEDRKNELEIQSVGIQTLDNIIRGLEGKGVYADSWTFRAFTERFEDECAGVWCEAVFSVLVSQVCVDTYPDYSEDYNDDFLIF